MRAIKDLTGLKLGLLTFEKFSHITNRRTYWICKCDCGNTKELVANSIRSGRTKSCGCLLHRPKDITGKKFGVLTAKKLSCVKKGRAFWFFECDCGNIKEIRYAFVASGNTQSCGCSHRRTGENNPNYKHGKKHTSEYKIWKGIRKRCLNSKDAGFPNYGGRGITICDRWRNSAVNFMNDMGARPSPRHSIDRIDNDKGYFPDNCRWATALEQARNTRMRKINTSGFTGVHWCKRDKRWKARISLFGKRRIKSFPTIEAAADCRKKWEQERDAPI